MLAKKAYEKPIEIGTTIILCSHYIYNIVFGKFFGRNDDAFCAEKTLMLTQSRHVVSTLPNSLGVSLANDFSAPFRNNVPHSMRR